MLATVGTGTYAAKPRQGVKAPAPDPMELGIEDNIATPAVPSKAQGRLSQNIRANVDRLRQKGLEVTTVRDGQVIEVTIPAGRLFAPGETQLSRWATDVLVPLLSYAQSPQYYKILVAVHADNTGSQQWADSLTEGRVAAIEDFFDSAADGRDVLLVPYAMGMDDPLEPNDTRKGRERNRRVEFYLVPDSPLIDRL